MTKIKWRGQKEMAGKLEEIVRKFPKTTKAALNRQGEFIMTKAKRITPVRDGHLRASGHVVPDPSSKKFRVTLGFGGPAGIGNQGGTNAKKVGYAVIQHEVRSFVHAVGQWKFLEKPMLEAIPSLARKIANDVQKGLEKGVFASFGESL